MCLPDRLYEGGFTEKLGNFLRIMIILYVCVGGGGGGWLIR